MYHNSAKEMDPFVPFPGFTSGKAQTLISHFFPYNPFLPRSQQYTITLPDNDKIVLVENAPLCDKFNSSQRIILLIHGLTGSHLSRYLIRCTNLFIKQGYRVFRMNLRGCGAGKGLAKNFYHAGRSEDVRHVLQWLQKQFPSSPVSQIGFSLGANITLKMVGEEGTSRTGNLDSVVAVSPPLNLLKSVQNLQSFFDKYFVRSLLQDIPSSHQLSSKMTLYDFDDLFTAPQNGFKDAMDYYSQCSSEQFIPHIDLPTFILHAKDDPIANYQSFLHLPQKRNIELCITEQGGHVGWLGIRKMTPFRWMDYTVVKWVNSLI